ncbi:MAG: signal peptidase I [Gammaproteobacteria bacterium]|nr:signal peptidase I [Gammaproteobacteria bacterium]
MTRPRHRKPRSSLLHAFRNPDRSHGHRRALRFSGVVLAYVVAAYAISTRGFPIWLRATPGLDYYLAQPLLWTGLAVLAYHGWRRLPRRPAFHWTIVRAGLFVGVFHVSVLIIAGVLSGFGRSPSGKLVNYPLNVLYLGTMLVGLEMARAYLFRVWAPFVERTRLMRGGVRSRFRIQALENGAFVTVTVIFFVAATPIGQFTGLTDPARLFQTGAGLLAPALVLSGVATWMASVGGPGPSIAYRGTLVAFAWFSPILPDLTWVWLLLIGAITPIVAMTLFRALAADALKEPQRHFEQARPVQKAWPGWVATVAAAVVAVALFTGMFGVRPLIVAGTSMDPALVRGDVVIIREHVDIPGLEIGDIVEYRQGTMPVTHRIVRIEDTPDGLMITTRGDNNRSDDTPVGADEIDGKVVFAVPWVGRVALWVRDR